MNVLHVPAGRPVRLLITSRDVIHSFFVPAFRIKMDVLPGPLHPGLVRGDQAGPLPGALHRVLRHSPLDDARRGRGHGAGGVRRVAQGAAARRAWRAARTALAAPRWCRRAAAMVEQGQQLAGAPGCFKCHTIDGSPHIGPTWLGMYVREETLDGRHRRPRRRGLHHPVDDGPRGQAWCAGYQNVMPTFQGSCRAPETAAIVEYIKSLRTDRTCARALRKDPAYEPVASSIDRRRCRRRRPTRSDHVDPRTI